MWALDLQRWLRHTRDIVPLHKVFDPRFCTIADQAPRFGLKHDADRGQPRASVYIPLSEHHEHLDPLAPLLADCLEK